jgi:hypothetical protein
VRARRWSALPRRGARGAVGVRLRGVRAGRRGAGAKRGPAEHNRYSGHLPLLGQPFHHGNPRIHGEWQRRRELRRGGSIVLGPGFQATAGATGTVFQASISPAPPAPGLVSVSPSSGAQGTSVAVNLTGSNFVSGGVTAVSASTGIAVSNVTVVNAGLITATLTIASGAATGGGTLRVATAGGTSAPVTFTVQAAYTFAPLQSNQTVAPGGVAIYQVAAQPAGYTGTITLRVPWITVPPTPFISCDGNSNWTPSGMSVDFEGNSADGSALLYVSTFPSIAAGNGCNSQSYTINLLASGVNPAVSWQPIQVHLSVPTAAASGDFTLLISPSNQTIPVGGQGGAVHADGHGSRSERLHRKREPGADERFQRVRHDSESSERRGSRRRGGSF